MIGVRHKVFVSYHHEDQYEVEKFIEHFGYGWRAFLHRGLGLGMAQDIIASNDTDYVMRRIRELYLQDSTVTIVLIGQCTWARRYVDWEIQSSLRAGAASTRNGLLGIILPSARDNPRAPNRLALNLPKRTGEDGYARWYHYPSGPDELAAWIHDAYNARTGRSHLIVNPRERYEYNRRCP
jgi:hypothetical protein